MEAHDSSAVEPPLAAPSIDAGSEPGPLRGSRRQVVSKVKRSTGRNRPMRPLVVREGHGFISTICARDRSES